MAVKKERIQLYLSKNIKDYIDSQADEFGMSISAYVTMCINTYKQQNDAMFHMSKISEMLSDVDLNLELKNNDEV